MDNKKKIMIVATFHDSGSSELYFTYSFYRKEKNKLVKYNGWDSVDYNSIDWTDAEEPIKTLEMFACANGSALKNKPLIGDCSELLQKIYGFAEQQDTEYSEIDENELETVHGFTREAILAAKEECKNYGVPFAYCVDLLCAFIERT